MKFGIFLASFVAAGLLVLAGCGGGGSTHQAGICPANPLNCAGSCCGDVCTDTSSDSANCGACGNQCDTNTACVNGVCGCPPNGGSCGSGQTCCGENGCKSLQSDINNCNGCGIVCGAGQTCDNGHCSSVPDMSMGGCVCASGCPGDICLGNNCCENDFFDCLCTPDPNCF